MSANSLNDLGNPSRAFDFAVKRWVFSKEHDEGIRERFARWVFQRRVASTKQLASDFGVCEASVYRWLNGHMPEPATRARMVELWGPEFVVRVIAPDNLAVMAEALRRRIDRTSRALAEARAELEEIECSTCIAGVPA